MADLTRLKGSERIRKRVSVMMGSDDIKGCQHTLFEIISNSIDRHRKGYGDYIKIIKHKDFSYSVLDYADGLPMVWNEKENAYNWDLALKVLYASDNYNADSTAIGLNGLGLTSSQYSAEFMNVISYRDGKKYTTKFKKGRPIDKNTEDYICEDDDHLFTKEQGERVLKVEANINNEKGTKIHYRPDLEVFTDINISIDWINDKLKKQAVVNKGLKIDVYDESTDTLYTHFYENGIIDYIKEITDKTNLTDIITFGDNGKGKDRNDKPEYEYSYDIAFVFNNNVNVIQHFHNSSELLQGGSTAEAIENAFTNTFHDYIKNNNLYTKGESKIKFSDIEDSLTCVISSFSTVTSYANQTKLSINNKFIKDFTIDSIKNKLSIYLIENKLEADKIVNQCLINKRANDRAEKSKIDIKKKLSEKVDNMSAKIEGLIDSKYHDESSELFITEGKSALGSIILSRNPNYQAGYAIRGKILSCLKASYETIFSNTVVVDLIKIMGCGVEVKSKHNKDLNSFNIDNLRYGKIVISTDSDFDGESIQVLLLTMIYRLMPELLRQGKVYIAQTPKYVIKTKDDKHYAFTDEEKDEILKTIQGKITVNYLKGLGELNSIDMYNTALNVDTRKMVKVTIGDIEEMIKKFEIWMSDEVSHRREFIEQHLHEYINDLD